MMVKITEKKTNFQDSINTHTHTHTCNFLKDSEEPCFRGPSVYMDILLVGRMQDGKI